MREMYENSSSVWDRLRSKKYDCIDLFINSIQNYMSQFIIDFPIIHFDPLLSENQNNHIFWALKNQFISWYEKMRKLGKLKTVLQKLYLLTICIQLNYNNNQLKRPFMKFHQEAHYSSDSKYWKMMHRNMIRNKFN